MGKAGPRTQNPECRTQHSGGEEAGWGGKDVAGGDVAAGLEGLEEVLEGFELGGGGGGVVEVAYDADGDAGGGDGGGGRRGWSLLGPAGIDFDLDGAVSIGGDEEVVAG